MKISAHGLDLTIELDKPDKEGWIQCALNIQVPNFSSNFSCGIQLNEFRDLLAKLMELQSKVGSDHNVNWGNTEENIDLSLKLNKMGQIEGSFQFSAMGYCHGTTLAGDFSADQSYISLWLSQVKQDLDNVS
jgi:hypothetical protein